MIVAIVSVDRLFRCGVLVIFCLTKLLPLLVFDPWLFPLKPVVLDVPSAKGSVVDESALDGSLGVMLSELSDVGRL